MTKAEIIEYLYDNNVRADITIEQMAEDLSDRKTEPQTCDTCKWGEWYRQGYDITMMDDECGGCCSWNSKWTPKTEPTISILEQVEDETKTQMKTQNSNLTFEKADEPQTERNE